MYIYEFIVACNNGTFGHGCINNCSGQCIDEPMCNKQTGHCDRGCKPGYTSAFCNESMLIELYVSWQSSGHGCAEITLNSVHVVLNIRKKRAMF